MGGSDRQLVSWSDDLGETWTDQVLYTAQYARLEGVAWGNGRWLATGSGTGGWTSTNGRDWTEVGETATLLGFAHGYFFGTRFDWGSDTDSLVRSVDGETWTTITTVPSPLRIVDMATETWP